MTHGLIENITMTKGSILFLIIFAGLIILGLAFKWRYSRVIEAPLEKTWLSDYKFAHRGLHGGKVPENSLLAVRKAVEAGYAVELDVRLTSDGKVVVFHDDELRRMAGVDGVVGDYNLEEIMQMRLYDTDERIPTLEEVLELVCGRVPILFEMKCLNFSGNLERAFYNIVKHYDGKYAVQAFSPYALRWFKKNAPNVLRGQLSCDLKHVNFKVPEVSIHERIIFKVGMYLIKRFETNFLCKPNFISCEFHRINAKILKKMREKGASILAWTIRSEEQFTNVDPFIDSVIFEMFLPEAETETESKIVV